MKSGIDIAGLRKQERKFGYASYGTGEVPEREGIPWVNSENEGTESLDKTGLGPHCNQNEPRRARQPDCKTIRSHIIGDNDHASSVLRTVGECGHCVREGPPCLGFRGKDGFTENYGVQFETTSLLYRVSFIIVNLTPCSLLVLLLLPLPLLS